MSIPKCNFPGISKASYTEKVREVNATVSIPWLAKNITCISLLMCMHVNGKHYNIFQSRFKKKNPLLFGIQAIINHSLTKFLKNFVFFEGGRGSTYLACVKLIFSPFLKLFPNFSYTSLLLIFSAIFNEFAFSTTYSGLHLPTGSTVFINYQITKQIQINYAVTKAQVHMPQIAEKKTYMKNYHQILKKKNSLHQGGQICCTNMASCNAGIHELSFLPCLHSF